MFRIACLFFIGSAMVSCGSKDQSQKTETPSVETVSVDGAKVFKINCALCHGEDGKLGANGSKDLSISELSLDERIAIISKGKNTMIAFEKILTLGEIRAVAEYTMTFKK
ncbi:MAG: cytochrome c [Saprospiraceae bacterium]|jgi:cytochrome c6|nr:cytochrome c [Saprospiraceae bacterium]